MITNRNANLRYMLDEVTLESFNDMRNVQPVKDRLHYFDVVLEGSTESNAILLQKLYTDIISKSNIDFGSIPDSRGNITKYNGYSGMTDAMAMINKLFAGVESEDVKLMNRFHDMIVSCKKDYEYGFQMDVEIIKIIYNVSVMTLYELINISILAYTKAMRKNAGVSDFDFGRVKKKDVIAIKNAKSIIKMYDNGQWSQIVKAIQKNPHMFDGMSTATEASVEVKIDGNQAANAGKGLINSAKNLPLPAKVIIIIISAFVAIRGLIYMFYCGVAKIKDCVDTQKEFVEFAVKQEKEDGEADVVIKKHTKLADRLGSISNWIEVHILHTDSKAKKEIESTNKENYAVGDFKVTGFGGDISF